MYQFHLRIGYELCKFSFRENLLLRQSGVLQATSEYASAAQHYLDPRLCTFGVSHMSDQSRHEYKYLHILTQNVDNSDKYRKFRVLHGID